MANHSERLVRQIIIWHRHGWEANDTAKDTAKSVQQELTAGEKELGSTRVN
jgi:hypothetical protein